MKIIIAILGIIVSFGAVYVVGHVQGAAEEKVACEVRIQAEKKAFKDFEKKVNSLVDEYASKASAELELGEKESADKLKIVLASLAQSKTSNCTVNSAAASADRSLRRNPKGTAGNKK